MLPWKAGAYLKVRLKIKNRASPLIALPGTWCLRTMSYYYKRNIQAAEVRVQGLKPSLVIARAARLKPCPSYKAFFRRLFRTCAFLCRMRPRLILHCFYQIPQRLEHGKPDQPYWFFGLVDQRELCRCPSRRSRIVFVQVSQCLLARCSQIH
jgi:hypothetical protein